MLEALKKDLENLRDPAKAAIHARFFKTGPGEYGEGDQFLGVSVPAQRVIASKCKELGLKDLQTLLSSKIHEDRLTALFILVSKYKKAVEKEKEAIVKLYLSNTKNINNWDLVDSSAPYILGDYFLNRDKSILFELAASSELWERRIAMLAAFGFIRKGEFSDALKIAEMLLTDKQDLIHKAVGWMLREVGNKNREVEENFLKQHYQIMPRTMLRYAIEKFSTEKRSLYLKVKSL